MVGKPNHLSIFQLHNQSTQTYPDYLTWLTCINSQNGDMYSCMVHIAYTTMHSTHLPPKGPCGTVHPRVRGRLPATLVWQDTRIVYAFMPPMFVPCTPCQMVWTGACCGSTDHLTGTTSASFLAVGLFSVCFALSLAGTCIQVPAQVLFSCVHASARLPYQPPASRFSSAQQELCTGSRSSRSRSK